MRTNRLIIKSETTIIRRFLRSPRPGVDQVSPQQKKAPQPHMSHPACPGQERPGPAFSCAYYLRLALSPVSDSLPTAFSRG